MRGSLTYSQFSQQESVVEGDLFQVVVTAAGATMAGLHICDEQQRIVVCLQRSQFGYVLGGLPVHYLAVVQAGLH